MHIINIVKIGFQILLLAVLVVIILTVITSKTSLYGVRSYEVASGSMEPTLGIGSIIFTRPSQDYKVGDIITFKRDDIDVSHRIVAINTKNGQQVYQTKGDANRSPDQAYVSSSAIVGKEIFQLPFLGRLTAFTKTPLGYIALLAIPTFLFVAYELWNIKEEYKKDVEKKLMANLNTEQQ